MIAGPEIQTPSTSNVDGLPQAQAAPTLVSGAPKSDFPSSHKSAGLDDQRSSPVVSISRPRPRPRPLPIPQSPRKVKARKPTINSISTPTSVSGPSINLIDHERSRNSKRRREEAENPTPTTNPLKRLRFNKTSVKKPVSLRPRSRPDSSGDQLAQVFNATVHHNHTMTQDEYHDDYFSDEAQATDIRNATPGPSRHRQEKDDEILKLREEVDSLRRQISNMPQNQQPPPPSNGLQETLLIMQAFQHLVRRSLDIL